MLLGFKKRFAPMILNHSKRHTIRAKRKRSPKVGEVCHCYTGLRQRGPIIQKLASGEVVRQKMSRLLGRWPCVKIQSISIQELRQRKNAEFNVCIDGVSLLSDEREALARSDGFNSFAEMMEFWDGRLPFHGDIIHWNPEVAQQHKPARSRNRALKVANHPRRQVATNQ